MVNVNDFDKKLIANEKYKPEILKAIGKAERFNLSNAFAKLIGCVGNKEPDVTPANLDGFFYWATHGRGMEVEIKRAAIAKLNSLLAVADVNLSIENNNHREESKRVERGVRDTKLRIGKKNIESIFEKKIKCKKGNCGRKWQIIVNNQTKANSESQWLHIPPACIKGKLDIVLENIIRHSMCKHIGRNEGYFEIFLKGTSVGTDHRCLYLMIIAIKPKILWKEESGTLKKPTADEYIKNSASFLPYCDYVILVPKNGKYFLYNLASKYNRGAEDWREISRNGKALAEKVRFGSETLYIKHNDGKIQFHHTEGATKWERGSIEIDNGMIVHVLVFNNYQK